MAALSYKGQFVDYVEAGLQSTPKKDARIKRQTIRNFRKHPIKVGETLHHFYGMRTKWCRKLGTSVCKEVVTIKIIPKQIKIGKTITKEIDQLNEFAYADGFADWQTMVRWWQQTHGENCFPFTGQLIKW